MGRKITTSAVAAFLVGGSLAVASPAWATSTVAVSSPCDSLTDGDAQGCKFTGNINTNTTGNESYLNAQNAYNAWSPGSGPNDITLTPLADLDPSHLSGGGITITMNGTGNGGTFTLAPGVKLDYFAVKSGNDFILYQYIGTNSFTTDGLQSGRSTTAPGLSHIVFFGSVGQVPEPATWGMMLIGFAAIGASVRRRRRRPAAQLA